jgi:hypothetical protein
MTIDQPLFYYDHIMCAGSTRGRLTATRLEQRYTGVKQLLTIQFLSCQILNKNRKKNSAD